MDYFDCKLLEIITQDGASNSIDNIFLNTKIQSEIKKRIEKVLNEYFIFVSRNNYDNFSENSWEKPLKMYAVVNGKVVEVEYSSFQGMYMYLSHIKISWENLYRTQNEAVDSIISKKRRKSR